MIVTDTCNKHGNITLKNSNGAFITITPDEITLALQELLDCQSHLEQGLPRKHIDGRKY